GRRGEGRRDVWNVPHARARRAGRHGHRRPVDSHHLGGPVLRDARFLVRRVRRRHADDLPEPRALRLAEPRVRVGQKKAGRNTGLPEGCMPAKPAGDYLRCLATSLVISNIETCFLPPKTSLSLSSALIMRRFTLSCRLFFLMYPQSLLVTSVRGMGL